MRGRGFRGSRILVSLFFDYWVYETISKKVGSEKFTDFIREAVREKMEREGLC